MLLGHLAAAALLDHYFPGRRLTTAAGSLFPDFFDKFGELAGLLPNGRSTAHAPFTALLISALIWPLLGRQAAGSWALAHLGHIACDTGGNIPWLYPLRRYPFPPNEHSLLQGILRALAHPEKSEILLLAWAALLLLPGSRRSPRIVLAPGPTPTS